MSFVSPDQFDSFFSALHGHTPYPWQQRLAAQAATGTWPAAADLPTGTGKTACIDIAIFALACQASYPSSVRTAPKRIFFCVNRRVIVDEAFERAQRIAVSIRAAENPRSNAPTILREVAAALRGVAGTRAGEGSPPLDVLELRGGIYRDNRWARSLTQPTVICTTVDQLGSRLLFRGYGVSPSAAPIQAALIAYDSLVLLDEAHISQPFLQTLERVRGYLASPKWALHDIGIQPTLIMPMTATPSSDVDVDSVLRLTEADRSVTALQRRLSATKPARLSETKDLARSAADAAITAANGQPRSIGIIVNRVATAKQIYQQLRETQQAAAGKKAKIAEDAVIELVIGSMRAVDRVAQASRLRELVGPQRPATTEQPCIVIATQSLEVGADYDFDALITECASLDALRQRFGRLNRAGRPIDTDAVILIDKKAVKPDNKLDDDKPLDPIYGNALTRTWNWLSLVAMADQAPTSPTCVVDFGIDALGRTLREHGEHGRIPLDLLAPSACHNAPIMLPAYVDLWSQTSKRPEPDPDVSLFIHGAQRVEPDIQVCWRSDLLEDERMDPDAHWCDVVAMLPPSAAECMTVPLSRARRWLTEQDKEFADEGDLLGQASLPQPDRQRDRHQTIATPVRGVLWRGMANSTLLTSPAALRPGDTLVLPTNCGGWNQLGHIPDSSTLRKIGVDREAETTVDVAEHAFTEAHDRIAVRLHPALGCSFPRNDTIRELLKRADDVDEPPTLAEWRSLLETAAESLASHPRWQQTLSTLADPWTGLVVERYPNGRGVVMTSRKRLGQNTAWHVPVADDGDDQTARITRREGVLLIPHLRHVASELNKTLGQLSLQGVHEALRCAVNLHDLGKADERFQALLCRSDRTDAWIHAGADGAVLAKSDSVPLTPAEREAARLRAGMPAGFRHEMLSMQLAERYPRLPQEPALRDLTLHLIAAHHGYARPFAPVVIDDHPPDVAVNAPDVDPDGIPASPAHQLSLTSSDRQAHPPHRLDSGVAERFWSLTRRFGWWGLAFLEAVVRLADQQGSAAEDAGKYDAADQSEPAEVTS